MVFIYVYRCILPLEFEGIDPPQMVVTRCFRLQISSFFKVTKIDSPNEGHVFSPEKVTDGSKRGHFEEPGWCHFGYQHVLFFGGVLRPHKATLGVKTKNACVSNPGIGISIFHTKKFESTLKYSEF